MGKKVFIVILVLVVIALIAGGIYFTRNNNTENQNINVAQEENQNTSNVNNATNLGTENVALGNRLEQEMDKIQLSKEVIF